ncbi:GNAT family N-acetyltransferase [Alkaliphilus pronyensis]|uniref:GNAT family N-acetyltransferase n=1 Tax=Alkaliphilus pronyensis TaxID=1482732 RepID=A0A6I0FDI4_9FIRM|nr:GNAT family N-acetyltransferase [Alkaliphilus pronyensis]KAB3537297.1 GNAT family N-acetyltransferase [Alkaliphilus pronyensis]
MENIIYRNLTIEECVRIKEMNPYQYINRAWREVDGKRQLVEIDYHDTDWPNGYEHHYNDLKQTIMEGGIAIGAFNDNKLISFITLNSTTFGCRYKHVLLDQLFVSLDSRGKGIGKKLFMLSVEEAKKWKIDKLYICAGSAEETIAFYFALGCKEAEEINKELYESDPRDLQLDFEINKAINMN